VPSMGDGRRGANRRPSLAGRSPTSRHWLKIKRHADTATTHQSATVICDLRPGELGTTCGTTSNQSESPAGRAPDHPERVDAQCAVPHTGRMTRGVELGILGPLELVGQAGKVRIGAAKERCVLAMLAVNRGVVVSRDRLVDALWDGQEPPPSAVNATQNYILRLRRTLSLTATVRIVTEPGGYRLDAPDESVDSCVAERLVIEARVLAAAGDPAAAAGLLRRALRLWRGPTLAEFAQKYFAAAETLRLEELCESAQEDLVDAELALGLHRDVTSVLESMISRSPLRERRWAQLVVALYRAGRQGDALEAIRRLRSTLADELGVDPSPELDALHRRVLTHDPALDGRLPRPAPAPGIVGRDGELARLLARFADAVAGREGVGHRGR
jgi:DNA-binding transcriptional activator of the SARP family